MFTTHFKILLAGIVCACFQVSTAFAANGDDDLLRARAAYDRKNVFELGSLVETLQAKNHVLTGYADYWLMLLNLEDADHETVSNFLLQYNDYPFADRLRGEYLKKLGKRGDWEHFTEQYVYYTQEDAAVACYAAEASAASGDNSVLESVGYLWLQAKEQPTNCQNLYDKMQASGALTEEDILVRLRLALADSRISLAKGILKRSKNADLKTVKLLDKAYASPTLTVSNGLISNKNAIGRELNLFALNRLAKTASSPALTAFRKIEKQLNAEEQSYFYGRLALHAAQRHEAEAVKWFKLANNTALNKDQLAWFVRASLRQQNWPEVLNVVDKMSPEQAAEGAWRYWKARALKQQNQALEANTLFAKLATERHFYGWLAQEELDSMLSATQEQHKTTEEEVAQIASIDSIKRAEALRRLDYDWEAKMEWAHATRDFDDTQYLAAAEYAQRKKWYDLAINSADKTTEKHDFALRYPTPYRDIMQPAAKEQGVDESWAYGITRQESRFMHYAKSGVGASGLMQLMPATARWVASKTGVRGYNNSMIQDLDTNISFGTYYLRYTLGLYNGQQAMATAAYNAGPSRAKKWMATTPLEGAIYAENIPFSETRLYVQKVLANAHIYAQRLGLKAVTLKQRLGTVPGSNVVSAEPAEANVDTETATE
jgi:soluble lytic murein transglycosylase